MKNKRAMPAERRVFIVHGWGGHPQEGWFPWLKKELERRGFVAEILSMPNSENPKIEAWIPYLGKAIGKANENVFLVGHSIGCQTILRYLESLPDDKKVNGVVLAAGFFTLMNLKENEKETVRPWLETPIDTEKIKQHAKKFIAIFSDDDPYVPLENADIFREKLVAKIIIQHQMKHFSGDDGITQLPIALKSILELAK